MVNAQIEIDTETAKMIIIILTIIYSIVLTPVSLYYANKLWSLNKRNIPFITKRHPRIVILSVLLFNIYTVIIRPFMDFTSLYSIDLGLFSAFLSSLSQIGMLIISMRIWLLYFDYNHELQTLSLKWKSQLRKQDDDDKMSWTSRYHWLGNVKFLSIIATIAGSISLIITMYVIGLFSNSCNPYSK